MSVNDYDAELYDAIEDLVAEGELEQGTAALGIARQVIHTGYDSLSPAQRAVYDSVVIPALARREVENQRIRADNQA
jgi:hypothetical protein